MKKIKLLLMFCIAVILILNIKNVVCATDTKAILPESKKTIEDGVYEIKSAINNKYVLDVLGASKDNGANVQLYEYSNVEQKKFKVTYLEDGYYQIIAMHSGKSLDVKYASNEKGANVWQWEYNGTDAQKWIIKDAGNGYFNIISKCNGLYVDVFNAKAENFTNIQMCDGNGLAAQKFKFEQVRNNNSGSDKVILPESKKTIEDGVYEIKSSINNKYVLDVLGASKDNGANVQLYEYSDVEQKKFKVTYLEDGYYQIIAMHSGKSLDVKDASKKKGANVWQWEYNGTDAQKWIIKDAGNGYFNIISKCNGLYVDVFNAKAENFTNIQMCDGNGLAAQKFKFEQVRNNNSGSENENKVILPESKKTIEDGVYEIKSSINNKYVLDILGASKDNGANVQLYEYSDVEQKKFKVTYLEDGYYQIIAMHSGKSLDVKDASKKKGANVWQWEYNGTDAQKWIIKDAGNGYCNIISKCNGLYVDVFNAKAENFTNIQMCDGNGLAAQKFKFINVKYSYGIDVSRYQINTNWQAVKNSGMDFAMIRAGFRGYGTEGTLNEDSLFRQNISGALSNGIDCGVYFFSQAVNYNEGVEEAKWTLEQIKGYNIKYPIAIDTEESSSPDKTGRADNISKEDRTAAIKGFCETIRNAGYKPMIYASKYWLKDKLNMSDLQGYDVWLAHYVSGAPNNKSDYDGPYTMWQYTSSGNVNGINGEVDMNICYKKY